MKKVTGLNANLRMRLLLVLILVTAFSCKEKNSNERSYAILFYDLDTYKTVGNVAVTGIYDKQSYVSNEAGFVNIPSPLSKDNAMHVSLFLKRTVT